MTELTGLPPRAHAKVMALQDQEHHMLAVVSSTTRTLSELRHMLGLNPNGDKANSIRLEIARLEDKLPTQQDRHRLCANLVAQVTAYLARLPADVSLSDAKPVKPKLKGETHLDAVARIRASIAGLASERSKVLQAGLPVEELRAQVKKWIVEKSFSGRPKVVATHDRFDVQFLDPNAFSNTPDIAALLCWFDPEGMELKLIEEIERMPKPQLALTPADKAQRLREIGDKLFDLEREEEAIIVAVEEQGQVIPRRHNADPRALLGLIVDRRKTAA